MHTFVCVGPLPRTKSYITNNDSSFMEPTKYLLPTRYQELRNRENAVLEPPFYTEYLTVSDVAMEHTT